MKQVLLLFFLFYFTFTFAQDKEYSIVIKDIETQLPIENATVVLLKTKQLLLSNKEGKVTFLLNGNSSIQISEINYEKLTIRWSVTNVNPEVIYLKNKTNSLDEIVLSKESPQKILQKIVSNSKEKLADSYRLKVYVREFFMLDGRYSYYNDGLVNFQFMLDQKKLSTTLLVEQNRSYGLLETNISADLKGYNLNNLMENYCNLTYFDPILDSKAKKEYDFFIKGYPNNSDYYVMTITPIDSSTKEVDSYEIIYNPEKKLIAEFTIISNPTRIERKSSIHSKNITKSIVKVLYRIENSDYYLFNSTEEIAYDIVLKEGMKKIQVKNSFVTTNYNKQNFTYKESDVFKEKTLFNKKNSILSNYWDTSGFTATEEEKKIINELEFKL